MSEQKVPQLSPSPPPPPPPQQNEPIPTVTLRLNANGQFMNVQHMANNLKKDQVVPKKTK
jgi:hypothetical protein